MERLEQCDGREGRASELCGRPVAALFVGVRPDGFEIVMLRDGSHVFFEQVASGALHRVIRGAVLGERVNRPDFGTGLMQLVFGPNSDELAATIQLLTRSALQQWLGDLIRVEDVLAESIDSTLTIEVRYTRLLSQESTTVRFVRPV